MPTMEILLRRLSVVSVRPFDEIVERLTSTIGHPDMNAFHSAVGEARTIADLEEAVQNAVGPSGLMEFTRFDAGEVVRARLLRRAVGDVGDADDLRSGRDDRAVHLDRHHREQRHHVG